MTPLYPTPEAWRAAPRKRVLLFGMSGLGKTRLSGLLRGTGDWFHYSVDYRIGTRYLGERIVDGFVREAMKNPVLARLLRTDSIYVASNITFDNLAPLSAYVGMPGDPARGGLPFEEYMRRQREHREAEIAALRDTARFVERAEDLYGYANFVCDSGGSICEVIDPYDPADPVLSALAETMLLVWIEGETSHADALVERFSAAPKPMYYRPTVLRPLWGRYLTEHGLTEDQVDPPAFARHAFREAVAARLPLYEAMSRWGVRVSASEVEDVRDEAGFVEMVASAIARRDGGA